MNHVLEEALAFTLGNEGGYTNHPADPGGATNFGIIQRELDRWNGSHPELNFPADVRDLTPQLAETIYRTNYWRWDGLADAPLAIKLFDIGVNCGTGTSVKLLQRAINKLLPKPIDVDGQLGPTTLGAANAQNPAALMAALCQTQREYYQAIVDRNPSQSVFLKGWLIRAARVPEVSHVL
ncbi:MAG TPA: glycosyl hydrolase 108 family protein [Geothrix sp.]|nr:glycosyl hydrolase 108 family protein [Geothrix sp.]